jgi:hypothetical protein
MSAARHQAAAVADDRAAAQLQAQYDPSAVDDAWRTDPAMLDRIEQLRKAAADHRAASQALRDAEANACVGIAERDRDVSPFAHRDDIVAVAPLTESVNTGFQPQTRLAGAVITFRALPGMTAPWLQRVVDCHLARNAALGHTVAEMAWCPLVPKGVTARVTSTEAGLAVAVRADDPETSAEVLRRARALSTR